MIATTSAAMPRPFFGAWGGGRVPGIGLGWRRRIAARVGAAGRWRRVLRVLGVLGRLRVGHDAGDSAGARGFDRRRRCVARCGRLTHAERRHDLEHPEDDQPHADHDGEGDDRFERRGHHDDARDEADDTDEDVPPSGGQGGIADGSHRRRDTTEDEPDADPDGQQQNRVALTEMAKRQNREDERSGAADEQQYPSARCDVKAEGHDDL